MRKKRKSLDRNTARQISDMGHMAFIDALTQAVPLQIRQFAFHGGTSLHLSWKSPRFSEDLDFLVDKSLSSQMDRFIRKIETHMRQTLQAQNPDLSMEITNRTNPDSRLINYRVTISSDAHIGNVKIKAEFWQVESEYLEHYDTRFAYPLKNGDIVSSVAQPLPAATLEAAYADKLTAFATREHLKWRDIFDLWWLGKQMDVNMSEMAERFLHHVTAYNTLNNLPPSDALRKFLDYDKQDIIEKADPDLKKWLTPDMWNSIKDKGVIEMVDYVRDSIMCITDGLDGKIAGQKGEANVEATNFSI